MKRDWRIELYRCLCMAAVVLLHSLTQGGYADAHRGLDNLMTPSVVGFIFISGYFGITCKVKSVLKLLGVGLGVYITLAFVGGDFGNSFGISGYWWFLWMYLALMSLAPIANTLFSVNSLGGGVIYKLWPFLFVIYIWSYMATKIPVVKMFVPSVVGFSPFGVLTFFSVYLVAKASRLFEHRLRTAWLLLSAVVSGAFCWIGFYHYNSLFALIFAGSMFYLVKRLPWPCNDRFVARVVMMFSPSMFSVYLLHTNVLGFEMLRKMEDYLVSLGWDYYCMAFSVAIAVFSSCLVLDVPRRLVVGLFRKYKF